MAEKRKKRYDGEGSIRQRPDGSFEVRVTITDIFGNKSRPSFYGKTADEALAKKDEAMAKARKNQYIPPSKMTVGDWLEHWLWNIKRDKNTDSRKKKKKGTVSPKTFGWYEELIRNHVTPYQISEIPVTDLRRYMVQDWIDALEDGGVGLRAISAAYGVLRNSMNDAVKRDVIYESCVNRIDLPEAETKEVQILTMDEQRVFLEAIKGHRLQAAFVVALLTGMREGEIAALTWEDVFFDQSYLVVNKDAVRINKYDPETHERIGSEVVIQDMPKTNAGNREIPLITLARIALAKHKARQSKEKMLNRKLYQDNNLVFCNEIGQLYDPKTLYTSLRQVCDETPGLKKIKFHALRHTFATTSLRQIKDPKALQNLLGHETPEMALHYTHVVEEQKREYVNGLEGLYNVDL